MNPQILEEAANWFVDFRVGDVDASARADFDDWLRRSPEHIRAYIDIAKTYIELPQPTCREIDVDKISAYARAETATVVSLHRVDSSNPHANGDTNPFPKRRERRCAREILAASVIVACIAGGAVAWLATHRDRTYTTTTGERRSITLDDGSTVDLNARSKIRVHFTDAERDVELVDGEAFFEVAKNRARPFVVSSAGMIVQAVGTQFEVDHRERGLTVTVTEGSVAVSASGASSSHTPEIQPNFTDDHAPSSGAHRQRLESILISEGEQTTVVKGVISQPRRTNMAEAASWMQHRLIFEGSRLSEVVDDINRYNDRQIVIENEQLNDLRISGVYSSTDPAPLIRFLREQSGIEVVETEQLIRITRP